MIRHHSPSGNDEQQLMKGNNNNNTNNNNQIQQISSSSVNIPNRVNQSTKTAFRIHFYVNGDRHFRGIPYVLNIDRIKTIDLLCRELSRILVFVKTLPSGVRYILNSTDGQPLNSIQQLLELNRSYYICSSTIHYIRIDYRQIGIIRSAPPINSMVSTSPLSSSAARSPSNHRIMSANIPQNQRLFYSSLHVPSPLHSNGNSKVLDTILSTSIMNNSNCGSSLTLSTSAHPSLQSSTTNGSSIMNVTCNYVQQQQHHLQQQQQQNSNQTLFRPKIVALLNGSCRAEPMQRPTRRVFRFLVNHRIAQNYEQLLNEISICVQSNIHRVYGLSTAKKISCLDDFFDNEYVYLVYGRTEKCSFVDFMIDKFEQREISQIVRSSTYQLPPTDMFKLKRSTNHIQSNTVSSKLMCHNNNNNKISENCNEQLNMQLKHILDDNNNDNEDNNNGNNTKASSLPRNFMSSPKTTTTSNVRNGKGRMKPNHYYQSIVEQPESPTNELLMLKNCNNSDNKLNPSTIASSSSNLVLQTQMISPCSNNMEHELTNGSNTDRYPSLTDSSGTPGCASSISCSDDFSFTGDTQNNSGRIRSISSTSSSESVDSSTPSYSSQSMMTRIMMPGENQISTPTESAESTPRHRVQSQQSQQSPAPPIPSIPPPSTPSSQQQQQQQHSNPRDHERSLFMPKHEVHRLYSIGKVIGDGKFGVVYSCTHRRTQRQYALKVVDKGAMEEMMSKSNRSNRHQMVNSNRVTNSEAEILKRINHPNIVRIYDHFEFVDQSYLVLELLQGGDLFDAISAANFYDETEAVEMVEDLLQAIAYLHSHRIVHRDIKLENMMVAFVPISNTNSNNDNRIGGGPPSRRYRQMIKLADFGLAVEIGHHELLFTVCGTPTYVAPEILLEIGYSFPVDIWAAGVIAYILLSGYAPFANEDNDQDALFDQIIAGKFDFTGRQWTQVSGHAKSLINSMLTVEQSERIGADQALRHRWIVNRN